jgi:DNA-binding transcriptional ArsR family regulator
MNNQERLGRTFSALVDPTRRAILTRLERSDGASVSELAQPFRDPVAGRDEASRCAG